MCLYILNQRYQHSKFEVKADEGIFLGYSSVYKAFIVFFSIQSVEESTQVTFDEDSFIQYQTDRPASILTELTFSPSDTLYKPIVQNSKPIFISLILFPTISQTHIINHSLKIKLSNHCRCQLRSSYS